MTSKIVLIAFVAVAGVKSAFNVFGVPAILSAHIDERTGR